MRAGMLQIRRLLILLLTINASLALPSRSLAAPPDTRSAPSERNNRAALVETYGRERLSFAANQGQFDSRVQFVSQGLGYTLLLSPGEAEIALQKTVVRMKLEGANADSSASGLEEAPGKANYFLGNDPTKWKTDVSTFSKVRFSAVYPGVDLIYYGNQRQLEYDFLIAPGADPRSIALAIDGAKSIGIDRTGDVVLRFRDGEIRMRKPVAYQTSAGGSRTPVDARFVLSARHHVRFKLGPYDPERPLVIDPVVTFSTYLGGALDFANNPAETDGLSIALDPSGNIYVAGSTNAVQGFPVVNAQQTTPPVKDYITTCPGGFTGNAFVAKLSAAGSPEYITYLGGTRCNQGVALAADTLGNASVTGWTESSDFPIVACSFQCSKPSAGVAQAAFQTKFDSGGHIVYSTYIASGRPGAVATDGAGNTYLTGDTDATFSATTTAGAYRASCAANDTYVVKLSPTGAVSFASCLGSNTDGTGIAVDSQGNLYISGDVTAPTDFSIVNGFQANVAGGVDGFLAKLNASGSGLLYSTFFGGSGEEDVTGVAADAAGNAYIVGNTGSSNLPTTSSSFKSSCVPAASGTCTGFVARLNTMAIGAASVPFATYLGGSSGDDAAQGVAVDSLGNGYVTGYTASSDFPTVNAIYGCPGCASLSESMFVTEFSPAGSILFSTFLGGSTTDNDEAFSIALDSSGNVYLTGTAGSQYLPPIPPSAPSPPPPIPACMNPIQSALVGAFDAFVVKLSPTAGTQSTTTTLISSADPSAFGQLVDFTATVDPVVCTSGNPTGSVTFLDGTTVLGSQTLANNTASFSTSGLTVGAHNITASYAGNGGLAPSTSAPLNQVVNQSSTQTILTGAPDPAAVGQSVTLTATVSALPPGSGTPTGTVNFFDGAALLGPGSLTGGVASLAVATLSVGGHSITASYSGDANFAPSTSAQFVEQVSVLPPTIAKAFAVSTVVQGFDTSLTFTVANPNSTATLLGVSFVDNLPAGLVIATPNGQSGACGGGLISAASGSATVSLTGGTLPGGANCVFSVNVTGTSPGMITNTTQNITSSNGGVGNQASAVIVVLPAVVAISLAEAVNVTDMPQVPSMFINVAEAVKVMDVPLVGNTAAGSSVVVQPVDTTTGTSPVTVTFGGVGQAGETSLTTSSSGPPPPAGFELGNPPLYYELSTTAVYTPPVKICINYSGITFQTPPGPRLFHFENGAWVDRTVSVDTTNKTACGAVSSLSPFALFLPKSQADLFIRGFAFPRAVGVGQRLFYLFLIENLGPNPSEDASFSDALPAGTVFVSAFSLAGHCATPTEGSPGTVTCSWGTLANRQLVSVAIEVEVIDSQVAEIDDTGIVSGTTFDPNTGNNSATVVTPLRGSLPKSGALQR